MAPTTLEDVLVERPADGTAVVVFSGEHDLATKSDLVVITFAAVLPIHRPPRPAMIAATIGRKTMRTSGCISHASG